MKNQHKTIDLTQEQKNQFIKANVDGAALTYSQAVLSHRTKLILEGYLTTKNQISTFDTILLSIEKELRSTTNLSEILFKNKLQNAQTEFILNCVKLFNEGWKVVKAFNFYTQKGNSYKFDVFLNIVRNQDKKDFEKLGFFETKKVEFKDKKKTFKKKVTSKKEVTITYKGA